VLESKPPLTLPHLYLPLVLATFQPPQPVEQVPLPSLPRAPQVLPLLHRRVPLALLQSFLSTLQVPRASCNRVDYQVIHKSKKEIKKGREKKEEETTNIFCQAMNMRTYEDEERNC